MLIDNAYYFLSNGYNISIILSKCEPYLHLKVTGLRQDPYYGCLCEAGLYDADHGYHALKLGNYSDPYEPTYELLGFYKGIPDSKIIEDILSVIRKYI